MMDFTQSRGIVLAAGLAFAAALGVPAHAQAEAVDLGVVVQELATLDPAIAGELAFLTSDPAVVVPLVETYRQEAVEARDALAVLSAAEDAHFAALDSFDGRRSSAIEAEIAGLDPAAAGYDDTLARLDAALAAARDHEATMAGLADAVAAAENIYGTELAEEDAALNLLTGRMQLSEAARAELRRMIGL
jgi:hypothetical protein